MMSREESRFFSDSSEFFVMVFSKASSHTTGARLKLEVGPIR